MYTVYKIVNMINKKIYIGVHKTSNPNDNYMGSSKLVKNAIKKYGVNNFDKRILYITEHENLAYKLEKLLVTKEFISRKDTYNLKLGGIGGRMSQSFSIKERQLKSEFLKNNNPAFHFTDSWRINQSKSKIGKPSNSKGKIKIEGDGRFEGCSHKGADNPRAKLIHIINNDGHVIHICHGNFHKILKEKKYPREFRVSLASNGSFITHKKYYGWRVKEIVCVKSC